MAIGTAILHSVTPKFAQTGRRVDLRGINLDDVLQIEFLNGPTAGVFIDATNTDPRLVQFFTPELEPGRYDLKVTTSFGEAFETIEFHSDATGMDGINVCPPDYGEDEYAQQAIEYLPKGPAWTRMLSTWVRTFFLACAVGLARLHEAVCLLITEMVPQLTTQEIPTWEVELALPEPCVVSPLTGDVARRNEIVRKFNALGGSNKQYFIDLAASLGLRIEIDESQGEPFLVGSSTVGDELRQGPWLFTWVVTVFDLEIFEFLVGQNTVGEPLRWWGSAELECFFNILKPAHTIVAFVYDIPAPDDVIISEDDEPLITEDGYYITQED